MDPEFRQRKPINENNNLIEDANQNVGIGFFGGLLTVSEMLSRCSAIRQRHLLCFY